MSVPGDPGLEAGLKAAKHDLETATTEAENLKNALGKLLRAAYEAAGEEMPDLELQDTAGEAYRYTLNLLEAGPGGAAAGEQDRDAGAGPQSEVPAGTAADGDTAARQRDRLLAAVHVAVRGGPPAAEDREAYNFDEATADLAGLPDRDAGASEEGGLADQLGQARAENAGLAEEASRLKTGLGTLAAAAGEDAGEAAADLDSEDGVAKAVRFFAAQLQAVPQAAVSAGTAAPAAEGENYQALGGAVRLIYEASGEEMPDLATEDGAAKAARFLASQEAAVPAGAAAALAGAIRAAYAACGGGAPNLETGDGQDTAQKFLVERMKKLADLETCRAPGAVADGAFIRLIYETSGEEMPDLETPEGYAHAHSEALAELKASLHRRPEEDEVSTDTAAPAADGGGGENHPSLGGIVRLIYDVSGEEMPDLATEDGAAKAAQFLAGRQAVLAGDVAAIEKAVGLRSSNAEKAAGGLRKTARDAMDLFKALAVPIEAAFDNAGLPHRDLATPEGVKAVGELFEALRVRGAAGEQVREAGASQAAVSTGTAADSTLAGAVRAAYDSAGEAAPELDTPEGAEAARRFLVERIEATPDDDARAASPAGQEAEVPAGTAPDEVTAAWQRNRLLDAVHEAVRGGPPRTAEDREAYNFEEATKDLKEAGLQDRDAGASQAAVSTGTAAPAAEGENYQALGGVVRLIYEASGEEMPDLVDRGRRRHGGAIPRRTARRAPRSPRCRPARRRTRTQRRGKGTSSSTRSTRPCAAGRPPPKTARPTTSPRPPRISPASGTATTGTRSRARRTASRNSSARPGRILMKPPGRTPA